MLAFLFSPQHAIVVDVVEYSLIRSLYTCHLSPYDFDEYFFFSWPQGHYPSISPRLARYFSLCKIWQDILTFRSPLLSSIYVPSSIVSSLNFAIYLQAASQHSPVEREHIYILSFSLCFRDIISFVVMLIATMIAAAILRMPPLYPACSLIFWAT